MRRLDFLVLALLLLIACAVLPSLVVVAAATSSSSATTNDNDVERVCEVSPETGETVCENLQDDDDDEEQQQVSSSTTTTNVEAYFINKSNYRVDLYWDDGRFGNRLGTLEKNSPPEDKTRINTFVGHSFFVTRHGTKEGLYDSKTDTPVRFKVPASNNNNNNNNNNVVTFVVPSDAAPSTNPCQDRFSICETEAALGRCWDSPGWMIVHCCRSCDDDLEASKLIDRNVRCSKERLNITTPAWEPGDLNDLFVSWVTDPQYATLEPKVWSSPEPDIYGGIDGPWVITFDNFLTDAEADALIRGGRMMGFERSTDQGRMNALGEREKVVSLSRTSSNAWCTGECADLPEVRSATARIETVTGIPETNYESFQILEYGHDQFYKMHHDSSGGKDDSPSGHRILTFFLYLSDVEEGGETRFNKLDIEVKPKKGRALIWPSVKDQNPTMWDNRMYHEAKPVIRGKKYAANHWIHMNDYMGPNRWGCTGSFS